jgi:predicted  nucleic acid-binding Zn-ribbon protein
LLRDPKYLQALLAAKDEKAIHALLEKLSSSMVEQEEQGAKKVVTDPDLRKASDSHADLVLLARLQLCQEMYETARTGKKQIKQRMENIRSVVDPRILKHYDRLMASRPPALVPVEGDTCQGCFMKLPSQYAQKVRQEADHVHTCNNCARFIYIV